jgi:hypothetical protein
MGPAAPAERLRRAQRRACGAQPRPQPPGCQVPPPASAAPPRGLAAPRGGPPARRWPAEPCAPARPAPERRHCAATRALRRLRRLLRCSASARRCPRAPAACWAPPPLARPRPQARRCGGCAHARAEPAPSTPARCRSGSSSATAAASASLRLSGPRSAPHAPDHSPATAGCDSDRGRAVRAPADLLADARCTTQMALKARRQGHAVRSAAAVHAVCWACAAHAQHPFAHRSRFSCSLPAASPLASRIARRRAVAAASARVPAAPAGRLRSRRDGVTAAGVCVCVRLHQKRRDDPCL